MNEESPSASSELSKDLSTERASALQKAITLLLPLSAVDRQNVLDTLSTFFGIKVSNAPGPDNSAVVATPKRLTNFQFSEDPKSQSPKAFMFEKSPRTDVERVACLAYYLLHYRDVPHVKTKDITALNTESAHKPFSNTAVAVENAAKAGYLVPSVKGAKQISALGERFVEALPDRDAAKDISEQFRKRKLSSRQK